MKKSTSLYLICILGSCLLFTACRFKSPTIEEQRELASRGAFPAGTPSWVSQHHQLGSFPSRSPATSSAAELVNRSSLPQRSRELKVEDARAKLASSQIAEQTNTRPNSPLARVAEACPGYDKHAEEGLLIVNRAERIAKYEWLVQRCPRSTDIWTWLGRDYRSAGLNNKAKDAASRAYNIDNNNEEAQDLLNSF